MKGQGQGGTAKGPVPFVSPLLFCSQICLTARTGQGAEGGKGGAAAGARALPPPWLSGRKAAQGCRGEAANAMLKSAGSSSPSDGINIGEDFGISLLTWNGFRSTLQAL